jgi:hypothetical protein
VPPAPLVAEVVLDPVVAVAALDPVAPVVDAEVAPPAEPVVAGSSRLEHCTARSKPRLESPKVRGRRGIRRLLLTQFARLGLDTRSQR